MTETENKTKVKNRAWVKNAAIVFLSVLLVLTFFSNSIMNYSLPVVSAQYPMSGTISAKIRGQGTVASNQSYNVTVDETREVKTVAVKRGDTVQEGQVLFILEDKESDELTTSKTALDQLQFDYEVFLLGLASSSPEVNAAQNALSDAISAQNKASTDQSTAKTDLSKAKADLEKAQKEYDAAKAVLDAAQSVYDLASTAKDNADLTLSQATAAQTEAEGQLTEEEEALRAPLTQAEKDLEAANLSLTNAKSNLDYYEGLYGKYETAVATMDTREKEMDGYSDEIAALNKQIRALQNGMVSSSDYNAALNKVTNLNNALDIYNLDLISEYYNNYIAAISSNTSLISLPAYKYDADGLKEVLSKFNTNNPSGEKIVQALIDYATNRIAAASAIVKSYEDTQTSIDTLESQITTLEGKYRAAEIDYDDAKAVTKNSNLQSAMDDYESALDWVTDATNNVYTQTTKYNQLSPSKSIVVESAKKAVTQAQNDVLKAEVALKAAETSLNSAKTKFATPETKLAEAKTALDKAESDVTDDLDTYSKAVRDARQSLEYALESLETSGAKNDLELQKKKDEIVAKQAEVDKLTKAAAPMEITAKYAGVITALNVSSGDKTEYGATMATIEVVDKGYTLELTVTSEQAAKVVIGDKAEITNLWSSDTTATLAQIVATPDSGGKQKTLRFIIEGSEVVTGQTLSLSIGQRSQSYDSIVPNSAIREDSGGKYVYSVETKSTPLSNRYVAVRTDVTVLATDDTSSAVSGLAGREFVIVSSTAPISAGTLVRMSDG